MDASHRALISEDGEPNPDQRTGAKDNLCNYVEHMERLRLERRKTGTTYKVVS
jgi:hypothetical protein